MRSCSSSQCLVCMVIDSLSLDAAARFNSAHFPWNGYQSFMMRIILFSINRHAVTRCRQLAIDSIER